MSVIHGDIIHGVQSTRLEIHNRRYGTRRTTGIQHTWNT